MSMDIRETAVDAVVTVREARVVKAQQVQQVKADAIQASSERSTTTG